MIDGVDVDAVGVAVRGCAGVRELIARSDRGLVQTYLPGRAVDGVRVEGDVLTVSVKIGWGTTVADVVGELTRALQRVADGRRIDVIIAELEVPGEGDDSADEDFAGDTGRSSQAGTASGSVRSTPADKHVASRKSSGAGKSSRSEGKPGAEQNADEPQWVLESGPFGSQYAAGSAPKALPEVPSTEGS